METQQTDLLARFTRRTALKAVGLGAAGFTVAQATFLRAAAKESDTIQSILDITATTERFGVTLLGEGLQANANGKYDTSWPDNVVAVVTAARAQERFHLDAFEAAGGKAMTDAFTVPPETLTSFDAFFSAVVEQEAREVAAQLAAMTTFTKMGRPDLAKVSFQYAAEEAEHRLLANYTRGTRPANNLAFAEAQYSTVAEFLADLKKLGFIGGKGTKITYPGPGDIDPTNVTQTEPTGPAASCGESTSATPVSGTPEATPVS
jgi:hypothetical protein